MGSIDSDSDGMSIDVNGIMSSTYIFIEEDLLRLKARRLPTTRLCPHWQDDAIDRHANNAAAEHLLLIMILLVFLLSSVVMELQSG